MLSEREQQVAHIHSNLIHLVVDSIQRPALSGPLSNVLKLSEDNGWTDLVNAIKTVTKGERNKEKFSKLDEEDRAIVIAIIDGIHNPATLPPKAAPQGDANAAAPGIAKMIRDAASGNIQALQLLANMSEQMSSADGDMAILAGNMKKLVDGERDEEILSRGMGIKGRSLINSILDEIGQLSNH